MIFDCNNSFAWRISLDEFALHLLRFFQRFKITDHRVRLEWVFESVNYYQPVAPFGGRESGMELFGFGPEVVDPALKES